MGEFGWPSGSLRNPLIDQVGMRLHKRDVIAREQPLELVFCQRQDRIGDLARPGEARSLQALDPQRKAGLIPIEDLHAIPPAVREGKKGTRQRRQALRAKESEAGARSPREA